METSPNQTPQNPLGSSDDSTAEMACREFANDPYIAQSADDLEPPEGTPPKTVEEILKSIQGFGTNERDECVIQASTPLDLQPSSTAEPTSEDWESETHIPVLPLNLDDRMSKTAAGLTLSSHLDNSQGGVVGEDVDPFLDVSQFRPVENESESELKPAPIRGAFEVDPEFYDFEIFDPNDDDVISIDLSGSNTPEETSDDLGAPESFHAPADAANPAVFADGNAPATTTIHSVAPLPQAPITEASNSVVTTTDMKCSDALSNLTEDVSNLAPRPGEGANEQQSGELADAECILAAPGDLIEVNGADGFGHIDLACFDFADAEFLPNQIRISCEDGSCFTVKYRNVSHAVFARGVHVQLADNSEA